MANNNSKNKTNKNKKNNTKKTNNTNKIVEVKEKSKETVNNNSKKEVKKITPNEEVKNDKVIEEKVVKEVKKEKSTFKLTSKQRDYVLIALAVVLIVIAFVLTGTKKLDIELPIALEGTPGFTEITYADYEEKLNTEAPFVIVIVKDGCGFCDEYKPVVEKVAGEYNLPIYYINLSNLTNDEYTALAKSNSYLKTQQWGTPTTLFMYGKTVVDSIGGYVEEEALKEFAKENFVVTENE